MEIEITSLLDLDQFALSHSQMEGGPNAGPQTWQASLEQADETPLLDTPEKLEAMRDFARASGGWSEEECAAWTDHEVNALFLQWIAGDVRQCPAVLEGVTFEARIGAHGPIWWYTTEDEPDMETGPFDSRTDAYWNHADAARPPRADSLEEIDWPEYEMQASEGNIPSNLFRADDGRIFFSLSN